jgi:uncharacterized protein YbaA (DUF1428 family)
MMPLSCRVGIKGKLGRRSDWRAVTADPWIQPEANPVPRDGKRIMYGSFKVIVER